MNKKRRSKGESKKEKKKKKKKKALAAVAVVEPSEEESTELGSLATGEEGSKDDSDYGTAKRSSRRIKISKSNPETPQPNSGKNCSVTKLGLDFISQLVCTVNFVLFFKGFPSAEEVCATHGLQDVPIEYTEEDYANLISLKLYQQQIRPLVQKENPKVRTRISL